MPRRPPLPRQWRMDASPPSSPPSWGWVAHRTRRSRCTILGLDSLMAVEIRNRLENEAGIAVSVREMIEGASIRSLKQSTAGPAAAPNTPAPAARPAYRRQAVADTAHRHDPFPLTDMQQAYWLGRRNDVALGSVSCYLYTEFDTDQVDIARAEAAWNVLIRRHDMLRAVISADGLQRILAEVPDYRFRTLDLRGRDAGARARAVAPQPAAASHRAGRLASVRHPRHPVRRQGAAAHGLRPDRARRRQHPCAAPRMGPAVRRSGDGAAAGPAQLPRRGDGADRLSRERGVEAQRALLEGPGAVAAAWARPAAGARCHASAPVSAFAVAARSSPPRARRRCAARRRRAA